MGPIHYIQGIPGNAID